MFKDRFRLARHFGAGQLVDPKQSKTAWGSCKSRLYLNRPPSLAPARPSSATSQWRPIMLQPSVLITVELFLLLIVAIISLLRHYTAIDGGLAFAPGLDPVFTVFTTFGYLYLPTIVSVIFSILWTWIDLDVKRLEPFYQMASSGGATLRDSLLLQYPFDYVAAVPIQAARRRHWSVTWSGSVAVLIFWAMTPLQNSMISTRQVSRNLSTTVSTPHNISAIASRFEGSVDLSFLQNAWSNLWYNERLPPFTSNTSFYLPIQPNKRPPGDSASDTTLKADSLRLWTTFDCAPPTQVDHEWLIMDGTPRDNVTIYKEDGCQINPGLFELNNLTPTYSTAPFGNSSALYCGQTAKITNYNQYISNHCSFLQNGKGCATDDHTLLLGWNDHNTSSTNNLTLQFCNMQYWSQPGSLTVTLDGAVFQNFEPSGVPVIMGPDILNTTEFEAIIASGVNRNGKRVFVNNTLNDATGNATSINELQQWAQYPELRDPSAYYLQPIFGFVLGLLSTDQVKEIDFSDFMQPQHLVAAFERAHQYLFAIAMAESLTDIQYNIDAPATVTIQSMAVVLVDPLAWVVQGVLCAMALMILGLIISSWRRSTNLTSDPDSLAQVCTLMQPDATTALVINSIQRGSSVSAGISEKAKFELLNTDQKSGPEIIVSETHNVWLEPDLKESHSLKVTRPSRPPFHLSMCCAALFVASLCCCIALLTRLQDYSERHGGLPLPSENVVVQQILLNYIPILFATFIEPLWTLLTRSLCLLQPLMELKGLNAREKQSVGSRLHSLPPQLIIIRALKNKHLRLAGVCIVGLSSNVLSVSLGALFSIAPVTSSSQAPAITRSLPLFGGNMSRLGLVGVHDEDKVLTGSRDEPLQQHFYVAQSNLTQGTHLPPWTTQDYFFMPLTLDSGLSEGFSVTTRGFGVRSVCRDLSTDLSTGKANFWMNAINGSIDDPGYRTGLSVLFDSPNGKLNCTTPGNERSQEAFSLVTGDAAVEILSPLVDLGSNYPKLTNSTPDQMVSPCSDMFAISYLRVRNATGLGADGARAAGASAPPPPYNPSANGPCHDSSCRGERRRYVSPIIPTPPPLNVTSETHLACRTYLETSMFSVRIDSSGSVLSYQNLTALSQDTEVYFPSDTQRKKLLRSLNSMALVNPQEDDNSGYTSAIGVFHNNTVGRMWFSYLIMMAAKSNSTLDPLKPSPPSDELIPMVQNMTSLLGSISLSLNQHLLFTSNGSRGGVQNATMIPDVMATYEVSEDRVVLEPTMYKVTLILLYIHVFAAVIYYTTVPRHLLSSLPTTLASQLGFFEGSTLIEDRDWKPEWRYGYGRFVGADGKPRIGIERAPFVQPLDINARIPWWQFWRK